MKRKKKKEGVVKIKDVWYISIIEKSHTLLKNYKKNCNDILR